MSSPEENILELEKYKKEVTKPLTRLFYSYGLSKAKWLFIGLISGLFGYSATLIVPIVFGRTIDAVFTGETRYTLPFVPTSWLPKESIEQFWLSVLLIGIALLFSALFAWIRGVGMNFFAHGVMLSIRTDTYEKMQKLDMTFFDNKETGEIMSILNNDTSNLEIFLDNALSNIVRIVVIVVGITIALFYTNWQLASITLVAVPLLFGFTWWFMKTIEPRYTEVRSQIGNLNTRLENCLSGIELIKTMNTEEYENKRVRDVSRSVFNSQMDVLKLSYFYRPGMELITGIVLLATFIIGGIWVFSRPPFFFSGSLTVGDFVIFIFLTQRLTDPLSQLSNIVDWYENAKASGKRICGLLDIPIKIKDSSESIVLDDTKGEVEYEKVSFSYKEGEKVLDKIDFTVEKGENVALVGPTGAGKSTVVKLLLRLYEIQGGEIRIDGYNIKDIKLSSLRSSIGYLSQDTFLFDGTIAENIKYGNFNLSKKQVVNAAKIARADKFIKDLRDGYNTEVGERGVKLSGGQRQRIAIARTVLQDPEILILDEATSAIDTKTEYLIQKSIDELTKDATTITIAHRLSTIKDADKIIVFKNGKIIRQGRHEELLKKDGIYKKLWNIQAGKAGYISDQYKPKNIE